MASLPYELPSEVVDRVVSCFGGRPDRMFQSFSEVNADKRELGRCSLVCRYWAWRCRPRIFETITLSSASDIDVFLDVLRSEYVDRRTPPDDTRSRVPSISECIRYIRARQRGLFQPFLHHISLKIPKDLICMSDGLAKILVIDSAHTNNQHAPHSLHYALPRSLPANLLLFTHMELRDVSFRRAKDILTLVESLPKLFRLSMSKLRFIEDVAEVFETVSHLQPFKGDSCGLRYTRCRGPSACVPVCLSLYSP